MRSTRARSTVVVCAAVLVALTGCSGDSDSEKASTTSTSSASSEPTYGDEYAYAEAKKVNENLRAHDPNKPLPTTAKWATDNYRKKYNDEVASLEKVGVTTKGRVKVTSTHLDESNPDATGGWALTTYVCSISTMRLYDGEGNDVSADPADANKPLPKGPRNAVHLYSYATPDQGKTWQLDEVQSLSGKDAKNSPCKK